MLIVQGDCAERLRAMPDGHVDAVVTDPPWNLGKRYGAHDDALPADRYVDWLGDALAECGRRAIGIELEPRYCEVARRRVAAS